jgi:aspartyl-tRNA(Asn)/glutamyl-tRNA(Gln) amidotransferase subunit A
MEEALISIRHYVRALRAGELRIPDAIDLFLDRIFSQEKRIGAFLHVMDENARRRARALQARIDRGEWPGPLTGVPIAIKDNLCLKSCPTTAGSLILKGFRATYSATSVERILQAGAIVIGKTNLDEFAMGSSNEYSAYGPVRNPHDTTRVPGGSSGGSAAAVAAGMVLGALGSDTGGSVRQPGGFCGLVALKPQYGAVSRYGLIAFGSSLDCVGPLARTAGDCALLQNAILGHDPRDATSLREVPRIDVEYLGAGLEFPRLGIPETWFAAGLDPAVREKFDQACDRFRELGATLEPIELPEPDREIATYYILANAEASSNLARYDGVHYGARVPDAEDLISLYARTRGNGFGPEVKRRILLGTFVLSAGYYDAYYAKAIRARVRIRESYDEALGRVDAIFTPMSPTPPFRLGEKLDDPLAMYLCDLFAVGANLTGYPAVSFPIGRTAGGLPIGGQLCGPACGEESILGLVERFSGGEPFPLPGKPGAAVGE